MPRSRAEALQRRLTWWGVPAFVVSVLTALSLSWGSMMGAADVQAASAAMEVHTELRAHTDAQVRRLQDKLDGQYRETTERLDRIFKAIIDLQR